MTDKLSALATLWITQDNLAATINALQTEADRVLGAMDALNADEYTIEEIWDCAGHTLPNT